MGVILPPIPVNFSTPSKLSSATAKRAQTINNEITLEALNSPKEKMMSV